MNTKEIKKHVDTFTREISDAVLGNVEGINLALDIVADYIKGNKKTRLFIREENKRHVSEVNLASVGEKSSKAFIKVFDAIDSIGLPKAPEGLMN